MIYIFGGLKNRKIHMNTDVVFRLQANLTLNIAKIVRFLLQATLQRFLIAAVETKL